MKRIFTLCVTLCTLMTGFAQTDSTVKQAPDTIKIGGMVIIREKGSQPDKEENKERRGLRITTRKNSDKPSNISTNWWIIDLGFSNYVDNTDPSSAAAQSFAGDAYDGNSEWAKLRAGKSRNVNLWFFQQRINLVKHAVNLKYGLGLELNNYFFEDTRVKFEKNPSRIAWDTGLEDAKKNKLAADYLTVPMMINFNFTPKRQKGFGFSAGVSAGYLYSARQKTKMDGDIDKTRSDFGLERWKLSYVGELLLGPVKLYGSYAFKNMWEKGLDMTPYTVGFRISSW
ncbi:MAG: outer membrane beta-barrel protein [Chitinophagaceae bacterium]|nr:outer membrane beta-barrel protein [Chitinophagaceae bacterium]